jgi:type I restriction enzyme S subunit
MMRSLRDDFADFEAGGMVFGSISGKDFANLLVIAPPVDLVSSYEHLLEPIERAIRNLHESAKVITALRDSLLPRLLQDGG